MHNRPTAVLRMLALLFGLMLPVLTGCLPSRIAVDLDPGDGKIQSTPVYTDREPGLFSSLPKVALIDISGVLTHLPSPGLIASPSNPIDSAVARLREAENDPDVQAIIIRVNSPGGTVGASDTLYQEIRRFRERSGKPVVVSMSDLAASGGYYISLAADHIVAQPSTVTGSIGVIFQTFNIAEGLSMIGVQGRAITSGPNKAIASPFEPGRTEHYEILQTIVDDFYDDFRNRVIQHRPSLKETDIAIATDGRVLTGRQALELGLVDELGNLYDAFDAAKQLAGLTEAQLVKYHAEGARVNSPYAHAPDTRPNAADRNTDISLFKLEQDRFSTGFYYLWQP